MAYGTSFLLQRPSPSCPPFEPAQLSFPAARFGSCLHLGPSAPAPGPRVIVASTAKDGHINVGCAASPQHNPGSNGAFLLQATEEVLSSTTTTTIQMRKSGCPVEKPKMDFLSDAKSLANGLRMGGLDSVRHSYKENFVIRCYEVGMNRTASIETIANFLQEVACNHAQSVGFSTDGFATTPSMRKRCLIWVTTRMHIEVDEYPVWGDVVQMETWCQSEGKLGTRRDWLLTNVATGKLIGRATSTWVMMNQDTRRLSRVTDDVREEYTRYCPTTPQLAFPEDNSCSLKKIEKLEEPADFVRSGLMPRRGDLDMNQHVNNVTYIGWTLESIPQHLVDTHQLHRITLDYRRECKFDDIVESLASLEHFYCVDSKEHTQLFSSFSTSNRSAINGSVSTTTNGINEFEFLHFLRLTGSDVEINRGRTVWKRKLDRSSHRAHIEAHDS